MQFDLIAFLVSALLIMSYYVYLGVRTLKVPNSSVHALNAQIREHWVDMVINQPNMEILAIQTLRNSVMAANFMASTSILLIIGALNISDKIGQWTLHWHPYGLSKHIPAEIWQIKLGVLLLDYCIAFYCFSMAIRFFNHVGYMINLPGHVLPEGSLFKQTSAYLNRAGRYYTVGNRTFYLSLPIIMWFFGPAFLLLGTLLLLLGLAILDKAPR